MKKMLAVIDLQNDFVDGALGTPEAEAIVPAVVAKIREALAAGTEVVYTRDTHGADYLETVEGRNLPVPHCVKGTHGWELCKEIQQCDPEWQSRVFDKPAFGSVELAEYAKREGIEQVELVGLCTDICVISNALVLKAFLPNAEIVVDAACSAGVSPQSHENALAAMKMCHVRIWQ